MNIIKSPKFKKLITGFYLVSPLVLVSVILTTNQGPNIQNMFGLGGDENAIIYNVNNKVIDAQAKTTKGNIIWTKADSHSGIDWNFSNSQFKFIAGGYLQTLSVLHGITSVSVDIASGELALFYGFQEPEDLSTPLYNTSFRFNSTSTYYFDDVQPNYIRVKATAETIVNNIKINYDCVSNEDDSSYEDILYGLENAYLKDSNWPYVYPTSSYADGEGEVFGETSKRALKTEYKNSERNYIELDLSRTGRKTPQSNIISLVDSTLTLKAKFSPNISDYSIDLTAYSASSDSGTIAMNEIKQTYDNNGWKVYNVDFSNMNFSGNDQINRIKIEPKGINESNKDTGYVLFDEITTKLTKRNSKTRLETWSESLENLPHDEGYERTNYQYDTNVVYGTRSRNSLVVTPYVDETKKYQSNYKYWTCFSPEEINGYSLDLSSGLLTMHYKPINVTNPNNVILIVYADWESHKAVTVDCVQEDNGWYFFEYNLSNLALPSKSYIRFGFGFDVSEANYSSAKIYIDELTKRDTYFEDYTQGFENLPHDTGWETSNSVTDRFVTASSTSINSIKTTFSGKSERDNNKFSVIFNPQNKGIQNTLNFNEGILEAKFLFSKHINNFNIRLIVTDDNWKTNRYDFETTAVGDGWRLLRIDLSSMPVAISPDREYDGLNIIRLGFGFHGINESNKNQAIVWIDDVFYKRESAPSLSSHIIWQAFNTETIKQNDATIESRDITNSAPLLFEGMRNEVANTQLMVKASSYISSYNVKMGYLYSSEGYKINPEDFDVSVEKYVNTYNTYEKNREGWLGEGYYPDALVPLQNIISANENTISSNNQQGFWINLKISKVTKPGIYNGNATLILDSNQYTIPVKAIINDACIPDELSCRTYAGLWEDQIESESGEGETSSYLVRQYYDFMLDYGINPEGVRDKDRNNSFVEFAERFANEIAFNGKINTYRLPTDGTYDDVYGYLKALANKNKELWDKGEHVSFFDKIIIYTVDEPDQPSSSKIPDEWKKAKTDLQTFKDVTNDLRNEGALTGYPQLLSSLLDIRFVTPFNCAYEKITGGTYAFISHYPDLLNDQYLDTPCPTFKYLDNANERREYLNRFDHLWFYGCMLPPLPYPSYHIDTPLVGQRMIKWMQYRYNIEGELYWAFNYYSKHTEDGTYSRDVWSDPISWDDTAGDGQLVYPGKKYNIYGPIASIRLENIRNAIVDYEYFNLIDARIDVYNNIHGTSHTDTRDLLAAYYDQMFSGTTLKNNTFKTAQFNSIRNILINILNELY